MKLEELGALFRGDPTFDYIFHNLPKSHFLKIVELRRNRMNRSPGLDDLIGM